MQRIRELYSKRARRYNLTANLYTLIGVRIREYRQEAVEALHLRKGDRVLEPACGTGLNFDLLERAVGASGRVVGVDLTPAMLAKARERVAKHEWTNVQLIEGDASQLELAQPFDGILCTFALSLMADFPEVLRRAAALLKAGGRLAILDMKYSSSKFLNSLELLLTLPFGATDEELRLKLWEEMAKHVSEVQMVEHYLGMIYLVCGTKHSAEDVSAA
jgi:demethylmenaquinone methyltransferase/2-methoxy-6-polyprenyl-1,4-benzoquinol methylase